MTDPAIEITSSIIDGIRVIQVIGEVDMATASDLTAVVESVMNGPRRVVVDLSEVAFLDSSGLAALVHAQRNLAKREIDFRVVSPPGRNVRHIFDLTKLAETLGVVDSLPDALT